MFANALKKLFPHCFIAKLGRTSFTDLSFVMEFSLKLRVFELAGSSRLKNLLRGLFFLTFAFENVLR